jgi:hypothetical protein
MPATPSASLRREADDLTEVAGLEARARELALLAFDQRGVRARARDAQPVRVLELAREAPPGARAQHAKLAPENLIDLARGGARHDNARITEGAVEPERDACSSVRLGDLVTAADGDALVVAHEVDDFDLLRPRLYAQHVGKKSTGRAAYSFDGNRSDV